MELFHGPTFAFKDVALQFLGNLFEYFLVNGTTGQKRITILGATSGDTGTLRSYFTFTFTFTFLSFLPSFLYLQMW